MRRRPLGPHPPPVRPPHPDGLIGSKQFGKSDWRLNTRAKGHPPPSPRFDPVDHRTNCLSIRLSPSLETISQQPRAVRAFRWMLKKPTLASNKTCLASLLAETSLESLASDDNSRNLKPSRIGWRPTNGCCCCCCHSLRLDGMVKLGRLGRFRNWVLRLPSDANIRGEREGVCVCE